MSGVVGNVSNIFVSTLQDPCPECLVLMICVALSPGQAPSLQVFQQCFSVWHAGL